MSELSTPPVASPGAHLKEARVAAGLHIAALAVSLKVPVRRLEAMEADRFDVLPDAVFVRALAASMCRALKIDATPVLALLPASTPPRLGLANDQTQEPFLSAEAARRLPAWRSMSAPAVAVAGVLLLASVLLLSWPFLRTSWDTASASPQVATEAAIAQNSTGEVTSAVDLPSASPAAPSAPLVPVTEVINADAASPALTPAELLVFRSTAQSWVEVTDTSGALLLRRTLNAGEVVGVSGKLPLNVTVGRADAIKVQVRGQPFDLTPITRDSVARFEVK